MQFPQWFLIPSLESLQPLCKYVIIGLLDMIVTDHLKLLFTEKSSLLLQGSLTENIWWLTDFTDANSYKRDLWSKLTIRVQYLFINHLGDG